MPRGKLSQPVGIIIEQDRGRHNDSIGSFAREGDEGLVEIALAAHIHGLESHTEATRRLLDVLQLKLEFRDPGINQRAEDRGLRTNSRSRPSRLPNSSVAARLTPVMLPPR